MDWNAASLSVSGQKVLDVAAEAFYAEGVAAVGVDALAARSGVSKPTLYVQFGSKRDLVAAVLTRRHEVQRASLEAYLAAVAGDPVERLLAVFDWLADWHAEHGWRGCAFLNVAAEIPDPTHPSRAVITDHKHWLRDMFTELARQAGQSDPEEVGYAVLLLVDGANARLLVDHDQCAAERAKRAAARMLGLPPACQTGA
ncbi:MAG TPA: TetR/AcrR family transcriptional regulator [Segeticoccus sp.]|nr:TetR/AcrR family transcriptional regulator [Segeticoccus sp.]